MRATTKILILMLWILPAISCGTAAVCSGEADDGSDAVADITALLEAGGRVSWCHQKDLIALDMRGSDQYYDIYTLKPDGSGLTSLTAGKGDKLPQMHIGQPAWHPSGKHIVFQAQDPELTFPKDYNKSMRMFVSGPGIGINNNLWLMTPDGKKFWQLTSVKSRRGVLHPHFSPNGKKLLWSEKIDRSSGGIGTWVIKLADYSFKKGKPKLKNIRVYRPNGLQLSETHGFSPNGKKIIFSGIPNGKYFFHFDLYVMNLKTGELTRLTDNYEWDEHAHFSPDGKWIIWSSSEGIPQNKNLKGLFDLKKVKLDYWIMKSDGSGKQRLTYFNEPSHLHYLNGNTLAADFDWGPDGKTLAAYIKRRTSAYNKFEFAALIELDLGALDSKVQ